MDFARALRDVSKGGLYALFKAAQRIGVDILPRHFYSEIPDIHALSRTDHWKTPFSMAGVRGASVKPQLDFVQRCVQATGSNRGLDGVYERAIQMNGAAGYGPVEADFLAAFVAAQRPAQIFQIGCGVSTAICQLAAAAAGYEPEIICVDPFPTPFLEGEHDYGRLRLIREKVEMLEPGVVDGLRSDVFFLVDSTHSLGPAGEVSRIVLEPLPRLKAGSMVHFHDITFPYDYPRHLLDGELFFAHESVLLHAFLAYNQRFRIAASLSMLHYAAPEQLQELLHNYRPAGNDEGLNVGEGHFPSATYLEVVV